MKIQRMIYPAMVAVALATGCGSRTEEIRVACVAQIAEIRKERWVTELYPVYITQGDWKMVLKIQSPEEYAGKTIELGVYQIEDLKAGEVALAVEDLIAFRAYPSVLRSEVLPATYRLLDGVTLKERGPNKSVQENAGTGSLPAATSEARRP